jgi:hypothetical protein
MLPTFLLVITIYLSAVAGAASFSHVSRTLRATTVRKRS